MTMNALLRGALDTRGVVAAIVATETGAIVAMQPAHDDAQETAATTLWTNDQVDAARAIYRRTNADRFLLPHNGAHHNPHTHVTVVAGHFLLLVFATDDSLTLVEDLSRNLKPQLAAALPKITT